MFKSNFQLKFKIIFFAFFICHASLKGQVDLESHIQDFIIETHKIDIPSCPYAFNPSIIRWKGNLLMSFRDIPENLSVSDVYSASQSFIYLVWLDEDFNPQGDAHKILLNKGQCPLQHSHTEDARLINIVNDKGEEHLYLVYSDNKDEIISDGGFRMFVAELDFNGTSFEVLYNECLSDFEGEHRDKREKNWVPFNYKGHLCFAYSQVPHKIFLPLLDGTGKCETFVATNPSLVWEWGEIRGGTPALAIDENNYLTFFHSSTYMPSLQSDNENILHYFMGAYTFSLRPPFHINQISPEPIVGENFYNGPIYDYYWKPVRVVFPCGFIFDQEYIWVTYGRQDHEIWVVKMDKQGLLDSLIPASQKILVNED